MFEGEGAARRAVKLVGTMVDITDARRAEEDLREARDRSEAANRAKDQFLAVLSHELRTPLSPVFMMVSSLEGDPEIPQRVREQLSMIRRTGYCVSLGERLEGAVGVAAPILDHSSLAIGSVQLTIPRHRFDKAMLPLLVPAVVDTAARINAAAQSLPGSR